MELLEELRPWIILVLAIIGSIITINAFLQNLKQRKLDNTFKTLDFLRKHITKEQIDTFIYLFHANNPLGVPHNEFHLKNGQVDTIENMFSEGGCGNGDIHNIIEVFNLISKSLNKGLLNIDLIWYEYGQIMTKCYEWTKYLEENRYNHVDLLSRKGNMSKKEYKEFVKMMHKQMDGVLNMFDQFNHFIDKNNKKLIWIPNKYYTYIE